MLNKHRWLVWPIAVFAIAIWIKVGIEFSFIKVKGKIKALGTGLVSSEGELKNALSSKVKKLPYDWEIVGKIDRSAHEFHNTLFVVKSLNQIEKAVDKWV